ncbi:unnamed protein product [Lampetra planeri]
METTAHQKGVRDAGEERLLLLGFGEVHGAGEEDDSDEEEEDEQPQLPHARLQGLTQDLQTFGVSGQLEDPEDDATRRMTRRMARDVACSPPPPFPSPWSSASSVPSVMK